MEKILNKIIKWSIYSLVFLIPIFFLPFTYEPLEFNKQCLLIFLTSAGVLAWLTKMIAVKKEISIRWLPLNIPVLAFLLFAIISTIFSIEKLTSIFGFYGRFSGSLIEIIFLVLFYFLLVNNVKDNAGQNEANKASIQGQGIINSFLWSVLGVVIVSFFSLFGIWQLLELLLSKINLHLPSFFGRIFNTIGGSPAALSVFLAISVVLIACLFFQKQISRKKITLLSFLVVTSVILLIFIDFSPAWIILGLSIFLFLLFTFWSKVFREKINLLLIPIILLAVSITFFFVQTASFPQIKILGFNILSQPREVVVDQISTWKAAFNTAKVYPVLGSGPATFTQDFGKLKSPDFNKNTFWQIRFDRGANQVAEIIMTMGLLGFLAWLTIVGILFYIGYLLMLKIKSKQTEFVYLAALFFTFIAIFIAQLVYYQNVVLAFLFWLILGLFSALSFNSSEKKFSFNQFPEIGLIFSIFLILIALTIFGTWFFVGKFYIADVQYVNGIINNNASAIEKAISLNGFRPGYRILLSKVYFTDAIKAISASTDEKSVQTARDGFAKSVAEAKEAVELSPNWVVAPENLGMIYRDLGGYIKDVSSFAINSLNDAQKLEPYNLFLHIAVGKIYRNDKKYNEARVAFEKALSIKPDYDDAKIQLALTFAIEGNLNEAILKLKEVTQASPLNVDGHLQLGIMYYNTNQIDESIDQLKQVLTLSSNNANALYFLGLDYNSKGDKANALAAFNRVLELNPDNKDVLARISEIQNPSAPDTTKNPSEPQKK